MRASGLCHAVQTTYEWLLAHPEEASCIGQRGAQVVHRWLGMNSVYRYMAVTLRAIGERQSRAKLDMYVPGSVWFAPLDVQQCLDLEPGRDPIDCVGAKVSQALAEGMGAAERASKVPARPVDWWQG